MSEGPVVFAARVLELTEGPEGRVGRVSVRGAKTSVLLDLVPEVRAGDTVLVSAGVALALLRVTADGMECGAQED